MSKGTSQANQEVAYLINTTPKYFYLLPLHFTLLERYASALKWPIYLATEANPKQDPMLIQIQKRFTWVTIIPLTQKQEGFLESRVAATATLPSTIKYVFPIQEDFLLDRQPDYSALEEAVNILNKESSVESIRLMPCPGPKGSQTFRNGCLWVLDFQKDSLVFTFQATLWRRESYEGYLRDVLHTIDTVYGQPLTHSQMINIQVKQNIAENQVGQKILAKRSQGSLIHLAFSRAGPWPNAVYLCPWPYRPTAVVKGILEPWAAELAQREGVSLEYKSFI